MFESCVVCRHGGSPLRNGLIRSSRRRRRFVVVDLAPARMWQPPPPLCLAAASDQASECPNTFARPQALDISLLMANVPALGMKSLKVHLEVEGADSEKI
eukprot:2288823-Pyramimonas_sp.AAC.1